MQIRLPHRLLVVCAFGLFGCADEPVGPLARSEPEEIVIVTPIDSARAIDAGLSHVCALDMEGKALCWGWNSSRQLGRAVATTCDGYGDECSRLPVRVRGNHVFTDITAGHSHSCGLEQGTQLVWCWGNNDWGQSGRNLQRVDGTPVLVDVGIEILSVDASFAHTCALAANGRVFCWGAGSPDSTSGSALRAPHPLPGMRRYRAMSSGQYHTCAIDLEGIAWCWNGGEAVRVPGPHRWIQISAGLYHTCAVRTDNVGFCWGSNVYGQLGRTAENSVSTTPTRISGPWLYRELSAGAMHTCGVTLNGRVRCWGDARSGQLGNDAWAASSEPVSPTVGRRSYDALSAGEKFNCGISDGRAFCWGSNQKAQIGHDRAQSDPCPMEPWYYCTPRTTLVRTQVVFEGGTP